MILKDTFYSSSSSLPTHNPEQDISNNDVLLAWEEHSIYFPLLYRVAIVILVSPASQVSCERSFSILKFIFSNRKSSMNKEILNKLLVLKTKSQTIQRNTRG